MQGQTAMVKREPRTIPVASRSFGSWRFAVEREVLETDRLARRYDEEAKGWKKTLSRLGVPQAYRSVFETWRTERGLGPLEARGFKVLDAGIGDGAFAAGIVGALGSMIHVTGLDIAPGMLDLAGELFEGLGVKHALQVGDARQLPFPSNSFDVVISAHMLEHLDDPLTALREMLRVLKPGGELILAITKRSLPGRLVQLLWRTHAIEADNALKWLTDTGFEAASLLELQGASLVRALSIFVTATKPNQDAGDALRSLS